MRCRLRILRLPAYSFLFPDIFQSESIPERFPVRARYFQNYGPKFRVSRPVFSPTDPKALTSPAFRISAARFMRFRVTRGGFRRLDPEGRFIRISRRTYRPYGFPRFRDHLSTVSPEGALAVVGTGFAFFLTVSRVTRNDFRRFDPEGRVDRELSRLPSVRFKSIPRCLDRLSAVSLPEGRRNSHRISGSDCHVFSRCPVTVPGDGPRRAREAFYPKQPRLRFPGDTFRRSLTNPPSPEGAVSSPFDVSVFRFRFFISGFSPDANPKVTAFPSFSRLPARF